METKGFDEFIAKCEQDVSKHFEKLIDSTGKTLYKEVVKNTPRKTGELKKEWEMEKGTDYIKISNNKKYALAVEKGHRIKSAKHGMLIDLNSKGIKIVPGRFMLRDSLKKVERALPKKVKGMYEDIWK